MWKAYKEIGLTKKKSLDWGEKDQLILQGHQNL